MQCVCVCGGGGGERDVKHNINLISAISLIGLVLPF